MGNRSQVDTTFSEQREAPSYDSKIMEYSEMSTREVCSLLGSSPEGLTNSEAMNRLRQYGPNALVGKAKASVLKKFMSQISDLFSLLLIFAAILAVLGGMNELSLVIFAIVIMNSLLGLFQEWRAEKAMETLKSWVPEVTKIMRDGELQKVSVRDIVVGDVAILEEGDRVPADARLLESYDLWTNNVPLTGESAPQPRTSQPAKVEKGSFMEVPNVVFMSTSIAKGRGKAVVFATGSQTQFGQIATLTQDVTEEASPLQKEINHVAQYGFVLAISVGIIFFIIASLWLHLAIFDSVLFMIGVMVACVPEGLQVTVSSALGISVLKMARENVLVKRLSSVQTLGSVTVICTDKTGTITKGEITVSKIWLEDRIIEISGIGYEPIGAFTSGGETLEPGKDPVLDRLIRVCALCNSARVRPPSDQNMAWGILGDPTDGALLVAAVKYGINVQNELASAPITDMIPFDSERKRMTTIHTEGDRIVSYTKGAPRSVLSASTKILIRGHIEDLNALRLDEIERKILQFGEEGLRVIAAAFKETASTSPTTGGAESEMVFIGLVGMRDPPRPEVRDAIGLAKKAGIKVMIITGDYGPTARSIAREVGMGSDKDISIIRGVDLDQMDERGLSSSLDQSEIIFARVSPEQKLRIVRALKRKNEVVCVTGDGANDAPSLKEADVGVAMGLTGTDVAREAADMILLDDSFASIVKAIESGRAIYENIRKFIVYVFAHNWAELIPYILYALTEIPLPLLVVQVLAIDLGIDVLPSLALSREPPEPGIMDEPPRSKKERLFSPSVFLRSLYVGAIAAAGAMLGCINAWSAGGWVMGNQLEYTSQVFIKGTTMTFAGIVVAQMGNVLASRTSKASIFEMNWRNNKWILVGMFSQVSILCAILYIPPLQVAFGTTGIGFTDWVLLGTLAVVVIISEEIRKFLSRHIKS